MNNNSNTMIYLLIGIFIVIFIFAFVLVYNPIGLSERGKYLQSVNPNKLDSSERWSRERARNELLRERSRRRMMDRGIYS